MTFESAVPWIIFHGIVFVMLALDLGVFHRDSHEVSVREALIWSAVWVSLALFFNAGIYFWKGAEAAMQFFAGYLIEKSLSVDNVFVFVLIFSYFRVPALYQHKVLFWGILSALIMRAILIGVGAALISQFHAILYVFGAFLIFTGIKMAVQNDLSMDPSSNPIVRLAKRWLPMTQEYRGDRFWITENGKKLATPLLLVLLVIEATDLVFAVDSIPAIFGITNDPFIVYTSNIFAILGLRALYFALAGIMGKFHYLKIGLSVVLVFVGIKMVIADFYHIPIGIALLTVAAILGTSIGASLLWPPRNSPASASSDRL